MENVAVIMAWLAIMADTVASTNMGQYIFPAAGDRGTQNNNQSEIACNCNRAPSLVAKQTWHLFCVGVVNASNKIMSFHSFEWENHS